MSEQDAPLEREDGNRELWATIFGPGGHPALSKQHWLHRKLPRDPRCRLCLVPFSGLGGWIMGKRGKAPSSRNPHYCAACDGFLEAFPGGAEVEMSVLFVDVRGSVGAAETMPPADVSARINGFLERGTALITAHDGFIMAFYGDCIVAVFPPGFCGEGHAQKAIAAAKALCRIEGDDPVPLGVGVHTGPVYIGTVQAARGLFRDVSIFGHAVNICARLAANAPPHSAVISADCFTAAGQQVPEEAENYTLKGASEGVRAAVVTAAPHGRLA